MNNYITGMQAGPVNLNQFLNFQSNQKIVSLPLEFSYLPVDILSKQFTKLNNPHEYRIHYLGPRVPNTLTLHKKFSQHEASPLLYPAPKDKVVPKYSINVKKIIQSYFINQKLRNNHFYKSGVYYRAFEGMNPTLNLEQEYLFNSAFQSGNLDCVIKTKPFEFDLFLRIDSNTRGHIQWFYFSVQNGKKKDKIRLNICNISKCKTLYENGMHPYICSVKNGQKGEWKQGSKNLTNVNFTQKDYNYSILQNKCKNIHPYCLSFDYEFQEFDDEVLFAYCIPYTFSQMIYDISKLPSEIAHHHTFGRSLSGIDIPMLHITNHSVKKKKKNIFITGRIHPAESNSSYLLKGFLSFLCSDHKYAQEVRRRVNFLVIPMINPDGVIIGNSRTSAAGRDMNRMFVDTDKQLFPQISQIKSFVAKFLKEQQIIIYYDFHGHSRKKNTFFYGPVYPLSNANYYKCRILPRLIEKKINAFRYHSCMFTLSEEKKTTGRANMFEYFEIPFTYTVQSSIGSYYDCEKLKIFLYDKESWIQMGSSICQGTCSFIFGYEQYELLLQEKRALREKKKLQKLGKKVNKSQKYFEEEECPENDGILKIAYKGEADSFINMIEELKKISDEKQAPQIVKGVDEEASSDDHDEKEDFQQSKLQQFNNLIIQNAHQKQSKGKRVGISEKGDDSEKRFIRNKFQNRKKYAEMKETEEMQFLEEICHKPSSSLSNRKAFLLTDRSSTSNNKRRVQKQIKKVEQKKEPTAQYMNMKNDFNIQMAKKKTNSSLRQAIRDISKKQYFDKLNNERRMFEATSQKITHFSQLMFPEHEKNQEQIKMMYKNNQNGLFRRNKQIKKIGEKNERVEFSNRFSQTSIEKKPDPTFHYAKQKVPTQFRFDEIFQNIQMKSKMLKNSVKYRNQKKSNNKGHQNAFIFPSSFYGVQQQHEMKKRPNSLECRTSLEPTVGKMEQNNTVFTVKRFK